MEAIELNNSNTLTEAEFMAKVEALWAEEEAQEVTEEEAIKQFKKDLKAIHKQIKAAGWKTEEGRALQLEEFELKKSFVAVWGEEAIGKAYAGPKSCYRLQNSRGYGFGGNMGY